MIRILKWLAGLTGVLLLGIILFFVGMRFHDGPLEIFTGGPFRTGELASSPSGWQFIAGRRTIEFQTMDPATSRVVWFLVREGRLFMASGYMTTGYGKLWKQWPHYLEADDRIILRIDGKLYEQRLERIMEGELIEPVMRGLGEKYRFQGTAEMVASGYSWLYEVLPRQ